MFTYLIRMESRLNETRFEALFADIDAIKRQLDTIKRHSRARVVKKLEQPEKPVVHRASQTYGRA